MTSGLTPSLDAWWKLLLKEKKFTKHKSIDVVAPKEEITTSWRDLIISLVAVGLETLLLLSLQQLSDLSSCGRFQNHAHVRAGYELGTLAAHSCRTKFIVVID